MKKVINCFVVILIFSFIYVINTNAECSYQERKEILNKAKNISINVEPKIEKVKVNGTTAFDKDETTYIVEKYSFDFIISNISEDLYVKYYTSLSEKDTFITSADMVDGVYKFNVDNSEDLITYYFEMSTFNENCRGEMMKSTKIVKPIFNKFSDYSVCSNELLIDKEYCKKFITKELNLTEDEFFEKVNKILNKQEVEEKEDKFSLLDFIKKYWKIEVSILGIGVIIFIVILINKRRAKL